MIARLPLLAPIVGAALLVGCLAQADSACDVARGQFVFETKCLVCHSVSGGRPGPVGPNLAGVVGSLPGRAPGFAYTAAMKAQTERWSPSRLDWFLEDPPARLAGTSMAFTGLENATARADVICYLESLSGESR